MGSGLKERACGALQALPHKGLIVGVGLDSAELGNPCPQYQAVFERAASEGLKCVAHAGVHPVPNTQTLDVLSPCIFTEKAVPAVATPLRQCPQQILSSHEVIAWAIMCCPFALRVVPGTDQQRWAVCLWMLLTSRGMQEAMQGLHKSGEGPGDQHVGKCSQ